MKDTVTTRPRLFLHLVAEVLDGTIPCSAVSNVRQLAKLERFNGGNSARAYCVYRDLPLHNLIHF